MVETASQPPRRWHPAGGQSVKILMFGKTGQVAREILRHAGPHDITALGREQADLTNSAACAKAVLEYDADIILNAAAYTAVDKAESEPDLAATINATSPTAMAQAAAKRGLPFLHISTDYVFDGTGTDAWTTDNNCNPINTYGQTKRDGEVAILAANSKSAILRTSWVFSAHGSNFVKTMLRLGRERESLSIVNDQIGGPTPAADIAKTLFKLAETSVRGIYHYSGAPDVSWKDFADEIFAQSGLAIQTTGISTSAYPTPAKRPLNSRLDCSRLLQDAGIGQPDWKSGLTEVLRELEMLR